MDGTAATSLVRYALDALDRQGVDSGTLARRLGLPVWALGNNTARVPLAQLARLWQFAYAELGDPHFGMRMAAQWQHGRLHLNDHLFETAGTLGEGLAVAVRYAHLAADNPNGNEVGVIEESGRATFYYQVHTVVPVANLMGSEFALATMLHRAQSVLGRRIAPLGVGFAADAPPRHKEVADAFGTRRIEYRQDRCWLTFARDDLELPLPGADPGLARLLLAHADTVLAVPPWTPGWRDLFREAVSGHLADPALSLTLVARQLALSPRTLQRRLEQEGTSWRAEIDALRQEEAARLLGLRLSRQSVAARLGYADARALRRALHRWKLASPARLSAYQALPAPGSRSRDCRLISGIPGKESWPCRTSGRWTPQDLFRERSSIPGRWISTRCSSSSPCTAASRLPEVIPVIAAWLRRHL